ncbi:hypothetical protein ACTXT7_011694 [Hymenolepis weldensis]
MSYSLPCLIPLSNISAIFNVQKSSDEFLPLPTLLIECMQRNESVECLHFLRISKDDIGT